MGRPSTRRLDRSRIGRGALQIIDRRGDFGVKDVADLLGVQASSLYHHVSGRTEIIELVRDEIVAEIDTAGLDNQSWTEGLAAWARSYRASFARHPAAIKLLATQTVTSLRTIAMYEQVVEMFEREGFSLPSIVPIMTAVESFVLGSALDLVAPATMINDTDTELAPRLAEALGPARPGVERADEAFELGLRALIAGLAAESGSSA